jgi:tagatose-1,6-bisphosphate aldolase
MKKIAIIKDKNKVVIFKNQKIRTPASIRVSTNEINILKLALRMSDIKDYYLENEPQHIPSPLKVVIDPAIKVQKKELPKISIEKTISFIEELEEDSEKSILEKFMDESEE